MVVAVLAARSRWRHRARVVVGLQLESRRRALQLVRRLWVARLAAAVAVDGEGARGLQ